MVNNFKIMNKKQKIMFFVKILIVILGTVIVSFGNIAFLVPLDINAGGLSGIGIIIRQFASDKILAYNLFIAIASVVLWVIGRICLGRDFAYKTLISTIVFPLANALFTAVPGPKDFAGHIGTLVTTCANGPTAGNFLLAALFGGVFVGLGVAITFVGGGSTGGVDVLTFLFEKYLHIKQSIASFIVDGTIVVVGLAILLSLDEAMFISCLSGIVSAFLTAVVIEFVYIGSQNSYQADIISAKWKDISAYAQDVLERGATLIPAKGGYHEEDRIILRVVMNKEQFEKMKKFIAYVDPHAFVTYTRAHSTFGEGFKSHYNIHKIPKKNENSGVLQ